MRSILLPTALCALLFANARAAGPEAADTAVQRSLDAGGVFARSLLLPAWGSYESESYLLSTIQGLIDLAAIASVVGFVADPPNPDAGVGLIPVMIAGTLLVNRLIGAPLNAAIASGYEGSAGKRRAVRLPSNRVHGRIGAAMGSYASSGEASLGVEWRRTGFQVSWLIAEGEISDFGWWDSTTGARRNESSRITGGFGLDIYHRLALLPFLDLEPGLRCNFATYRYEGYAMEAHSYDYTGQWSRTHSNSLSVIPRASLVSHPYRRLEVGLGAGYAWLRPGHFRDFRRRAASLDRNARDPGAWRFNAELAVPIW